MSQYSTHGPRIRSERREAQMAAPPVPGSATCAELDCGQPIAGWTAPKCAMGLCPVHALPDLWEEIQDELAAQGCPQAASQAANIAADGGRSLAEIAQDEPDFADGLRLEEAPRGFAFFRGTERVTRYWMDPRAERAS